MPSTFRPSVRAGPVAAAILVAVLLAAGASAGLDATISGSTSASTPPRANVLVGFTTPGVNATLIAAAGGTLLKRGDSIGLATVYTTNVSAFMLAMAGAPGVAFVEPNLATHLDSSGWDSSGWDSSGWDSSGWDSSGWDSSGWDSSGWDSSGWDSSGWDSSGWDSSGWDSSGWDSSGWDSSGWDSSGWDSSGWDTAGNHSLFDGAWLTSAGAPASKGVDPLLHRQWGLRAVNASPATLRQGAGSAICIVDSGVDSTHPDLAGKMWTAPDGTHGYDFVNMDTDPMDDAGHGTHVAGIAAAATGNGAGIAGLSREKIMAVKVLAADGTGTEGNLALGIAWCADHGAKVVSLSLGTDVDSKAVHRAVSYAFSHGAALVASVGNTGPCSGGCVRYPASYPEVMGVTALGTNGQPLRSDATGSLVSIAAPGWGIVSTWTGGSYRALNGTSMAVPFVSATLAQVMDLNSTLAPAAADNLVVHAAKDLGPAGRDPYVGYGVVDVGAALAAAAAR
ncbi:MAG: thermitase [Thermoplasmata archaeon]|jgi:subtilisin family serine protease|nr:thermitase [Thermoplasmata archaeon]